MTGRHRLFSHHTAAAASFDRLQLLFKIGDTAIREFAGLLILTVPLGIGEFIARLLQLARIGPDDTVLEIGCATGYGTAVLARLARSVVAVEGDRALAAQATARLRELGLGNAAVVEAPPTQGCPGRAPYAAIVFAGAIVRVADGIASQLAEGGRMVAVVQQENGLGQGMVMTRAGGVLSRRASFDAAVPLLPGFHAEPSFVF